MTTRLAVFYHRANTFGGSFNSVVGVVTRIDRGRFEPVTLVPGPGNCADTFAHLGVASIYRSEHRGEKSLRYLRAVLSFRRLLRRQRIGLVYVSDYVTWRSAELVAARAAGVPRVVHVRAPLPERGLDPELLGATVVVGNSEATIRPLRAVMPHNQVRIVHNFIDFDRFSNARDRRDLFFDGRPPVVGFLGVFRPEKGIEYFLKMARRILASRPDVRFLAVGGESAVEDVGWYPKMRQYAVDLGIANAVHFTGARDDVPDMMRSMDVLVVPSLNEGFGRVILEANAVGIPVVGADAAGIPEVIEPGVTGELVPPRDPASMASAVLRMLDDAAWRDWVRGDAPLRVRRRFSPEVQMEYLHEAWTEALAVPARRRL